MTYSEALQDMWKEKKAPSIPFLYEETQAPLLKAVFEPRTPVSQSHLLLAGMTDLYLVDLRCPIITINVNTNVGTYLKHKVTFPGFCLFLV